MGEDEASNNSNPVPVTMKTQSSNNYGLNSDVNSNSLSQKFINNGISINDTAHIISTTRKFEGVTP